ncbi:MAG TPA: GNAT family N-acetyltransferase [Nocardioidaceae bacterium]|nr:GNAT family N-acetyltransferase [Nocardioidaceae bacterium]
MSEPATTPLTADDDGLAVPARLRDGRTAGLRPLRPGETEALLAVFDGMSPASRALRYLTGLHELPRQMLSVLTDVDGDRHVAWLASVEGQPVGIARYVRLPGCPTSAELALEVTDRLQGRGLGTVLVDAVTTVAAARGVRRVQGTMAPSNDASRRLLERVGARGGLVEGLLELEGRLRLLDPPAVDRAAVLRLACAPDPAVTDGWVWTG